MGLAICRSIIEAHDGEDLGGKPGTRGGSHLTIHSAVAIMTKKPETAGRTERDSLHR